MEQCATLDLEFDCVHVNKGTCKGDQCNLFKACVEGRLDLPRCRIWFTYEACDPGSRGRPPSGPEVEIHNPIWELIDLLPYIPVSYNLPGLVLDAHEEYLEALKLEYQIEQQKQRMETS